MRVLWHSYRPTSADAQSVTGDSAWQAVLFDHLSRSNVHVETTWNGIILSTSSIRSSIDMIFFIWRWPMPAYPDRQAAFDSQWHLLRIARDYGIPFLVYDLDHMMTREDREWILDAGGVIASPAYHPIDELTMWLPLPSPYSSIYTGGDRGVGLAYIGNNYGRYAQTKKYLGPLNAEMYGNWLVPGPDREDPRVVDADFPNARFRGRLPADQVVNRLSNTYATIHLAKPSYCKTSFATIRYAEALAAGCVGFIPSEFTLPLGFNGDQLIVNSAEELAEKMAIVKSVPAYRYNLLAIGATFVERFMSWKSWLPVLRKVSGRKY